LARALRGLKRWSVRGLQVPGCFGAADPLRGRVFRALSLALLKPSAGWACVRGRPPDLEARAALGGAGWEGVRLSAQRQRGDLRLGRVERKPTPPLVPESIHSLSR
jgi:hypothetical protein